MKKKKIICVIPARLNSTRFPEKIITLLDNKPLLQWTWEAARSCTQFEKVVFAIDSPKTAQIIDSFGGTYYFTSPECRTGTERLVELCITKKLTADIWVNWQADEPFITKSMIETLLSSCQNDQAFVWTLKKKIEREEEIRSPHVVKVVTDKDNFAFYFSRSPIPYYVDQAAQNHRNYYKHLGIYAYTQEALSAIATLPPSPLELAESLEQLRFLHNQLKIRVHETTQETIGIDTQNDLQQAQNYLKISKKITKKA